MGTQGELIKGKKLLFGMCFQSYDFRKDPPLQFIQEALTITHFFLVGNIWSLFVR